MYLGDVSCSREAEGEGTNGSWHKSQGDLITTVPDGLDGLADIPVVMSHAYVLQTAENDADGLSVLLRTIYGLTDQIGSELLP